MPLTIERRIVERTDNRPCQDFANGLADYITIHETANPDAGASAHASWMFREGGAPYAWHATVDDSVTLEQNPIIYQSLEWSEQGWHAGDGRTGPGNTSSIGIELCVNDGSNLQQTRDSAAQLVAHLRKQGHGKLGVVPHRHWSGKNCPTIILENGLWDAFLKSVANAEITKEAAPPVIDPEPRTVPPLPATPPIHLPPTPPVRKPPVKLVQSALLPPLAQNKRNVVKSAPEILATGSTGGILALINTITPNGVPTEAIIGVLVGAPPILFMIRRYLRDLIKFYKELKSSL
tara:strand:+ start:8286 stop:9158 length:873 start_codon:yes stop_codon:yes gene_type:complete